MGIAAFDKWLVRPGIEGISQVADLSDGGGLWDGGLLILGEWLLMLVALLLPGIYHRLFQKSSG
jgi:hypothetical protein